MDNFIARCRGQLCARRSAALAMAEIGIEVAFSCRPWVLEDKVVDQLYMSPDPSCS